MDNKTSTASAVSGILSYIQGLPAPLAVIVSGLIPGFEPRYSVILGVLLGLPLAESFFLASITVLILSLVLTYLIDLVDKTFPLIPGIGRLYVSYKAKASYRASRYVQRYGMLGLVLFIAIPFPATGMYTGALAGLLLGVRGRQMLLALIAGGMISVAIASIAVMLGLSIQSW